MGERDEYAERGRGKSFPSRLSESKRAMTQTIGLVMKAIRKEPGSDFGSVSESAINYTSCSVTYLQVFIPHSKSTDLDRLRCNGAMTDHGLSFLCLGFSPGKE